MFLPLAQEISPVRSLTKFSISSQVLRNGIVWDMKQKQFTINFFFPLMLNGMFTFLMKKQALQNSTRRLCSIKNTYVGNGVIWEEHTLYGKLLRLQIQALKPFCFNNTFYKM